jgi:AhpD family alkylhydroperoxidase
MTDPAAIDPAADPAAALAAIRSRARALNRAIPEAMAGFAQLSKAAKGGAALGAKEKECVALGISIAVRCEDCILFHLEALRKAGGTREELAEVLAVAVQMGGGPSVMYAARALAAWDELAG